MPSSYSLVDRDFLCLLDLIHVPVPVELNQDDSVGDECGGDGGHQQDVSSLLDGSEYPYEGPRPVHVRRDDR